MTSQPVSRGRELKAARIRAGLKQADAAKQLDVHPVTLSRIERGEQKKIDAKLYSQMRRLYGIDQSGGDAAFVDESASGWPELRAPSRVSEGIPQRFRVFLQEFLLEHTKLGVPAEEIESARQILSRDELFRRNWGGESREYTEDEILEGIQAHADIYAQRWRKKYKLAQ